MAKHFQPKPRAPTRDCGHHHSKTFQILSFRTVFVIVCKDYIIWESVPNLGCFTVNAYCCPLSFPVRRTNIPHCSLPLFNDYLYLPYSFPPSLSPFLTPPSLMRSRSLAPSHPYALLLPFLHASLPTWLPPSRPLSIHPSLPPSHPPSLPACPPARLPACPPARLPACPPARLPACPPARLPACPPARLPACPPARLPACLSAPPLPPSIHPHFHPLPPAHTETRARTQSNILYTCQ